LEGCIIFGPDIDHLLNILDGFSVVHAVGEDAEFEKTGLGYQILDALDIILMLFAASRDADFYPALVQWPDPGETQTTFQSLGHARRQIGIRFLVIVTPIDFIHQDGSAHLVEIRSCGRAKVELPDADHAAGDNQDQDQDDEPGVLFHGCTRGSTFGGTHRLLVNLQMVIFNCQFAMFVFTADSRIDN